MPGPLRSSTDPGLSAVPPERLAVWVASLAEASEQAVAFIDEQWRIQYWSPRAAQILGWEARTALGKGLTSVLGMPTESGRQLRARVGGRGGLDRERLGLRKAGGTRFEVAISFRRLPAADPSGEASGGYLVTLRDDVDSRLTQEFQKFFHAVDQSLIGALITSPDGAIEYANPRAVDILGVSPLQLVGNSLFAPAADEPPADSIALFPGESARAGEWRDDLRFISPSRGPIDLYAVLSGIRDASGALVNRIALFEDVTERRTLELAERELRDSLAHAGRLASLGEMATTIAHEINQPLTAIANYSRGSLRRIGQGELRTEAVVDALNEISREVGRAGDIVRNVRRLARTSQKTLRPIDLVTLLRQIVGLLRMSARSPAVRIEFDTPMAEAWVTGDDTQLSQVILNLGRNGIEAMRDLPSGRRHLEIRLHPEAAAPGPAIVRIAVIDRGTGIADEHLAIIGTPFFTLKPQGLGLGLSITRTLLEAHGTRLEVRRNGPGLDGMNFSFSMPLCATGPGAPK